MGVAVLLHHMESMQVCPAWPNTCNQCALATALSGISETDCNNNCCEQSAILLIVLGLPCWPQRAGTCACTEGSCPMHTTGMQVLGAALTLSLGLSLVCNLVQWRDCKSLQSRWVH